MDIEVLGRPGVRIAGERIELKGRQPALLGALAIAAPRPVTADALLEAVWGEDLPGDPANALQQRISTLRRTLDPDRVGEVLVTVAGGYALRVGDDHLDAHRFARQVAEGRELLADGDVEAARDRLAAALALWRGPALDGVADEGWALAEARRLEELRLVAIEDRIEADLGLGAGAELIAELTDLVGAEPLRERLCGQLMRALYRAGRQADALARYEGMRELLAEELGVDPGPELQRIHLQVLEQADDLEVAVLSRPRRPRRSTNVPAPTRTVIGREQAIDRVDRLLRAGRLVTLTGPGGAGKTTVALEVARRLDPPPDGTWFVELAALQGEAGLLDGVAGAVGVDAGAGAAGFTLPGVVEALADRELLVVLDNAEHLVEQLAPIVEALLHGVPGLRVLATSREPLGVDGEAVWSLPTLGVPEAGERDPEVVLAAPAVQLLVERIRSQDPTFHLDVEVAPAAATIVRQLDGIPLAVELAAARARVLSLPELAAALDDRFAVLAGGRRTAPSRQRTLRGAIDWSWELADEASRTAWAALSVPVTGADHGMAAGLLDAAGIAAPALEALSALVDRSIITVDTDRSGTRYRMLGSLRAYGEERLRELGLDAAVRDRHAEVVAERLVAAHDTADVAAFGVDLAALAASLDEARAALRWAARSDDRPRLQALAGQLGWLWLLRGLADEGLGWLDRGIGAIDGAPPEHLDVSAVEPSALLWASGLRTTGLASHGGAWAELAVAAATEPRDLVLAEAFAAIHRAHAGDIEPALDDLRTVVTHAEESGGWLLGFAHLLTAQIARISGRMGVVREHAERAADLLTAEDAGWARAQALDIIIDAVDPTVDPARARRLATEGLELCRRRGFPELEGRMLLQLGVATHVAGDQQLARAYLDEAVELTAQVGRGPSLGFALVVAGAHARDRGEHELARQQLTEARDLLVGTAMTYGSARAALELGRTLRDLGDTAAASELAAEGLRLAERIADPDLLTGLEDLAADTPTTG